MGDNSQNQSSDPLDVEGATARVRTQSECSLASDDGNSNLAAIGKRQRTTSQTFMVPGLTSASPPKFVSLEEIMQAANGMKDMALVHQIVVDKEFRLERYEPEPNTFHRAVKDSMHNAYWKQIREDLNEDPPDYESALNLLVEARASLVDLLLPQHTKIRQQIYEVLDKDLIAQQAEKGILDFKHYAQYVISVMGKLCAPVRDDKIKELTEMTDVVDTFKGIMETLDLMALDMANFTIEIAKPDIIAHSVQLERKKFSDYLAVQPDGLEFTRKWLLKHLNTAATPEVGVDRNTFIRNLTKETVTKAAIELIEWDKNLPYPETFLLDELRLRDLQVRTERLIIVGTVLLSTMSSVGSNLNSLTSFKQTIKDHCTVILESYSSESDLKELLPNIVLQVVKDIKEAQQEHGYPEIPETQLKYLDGLITDISRDDHKIKQLVKQRTKEFFLQIIASCTAAPQKVPSGLTALQGEITAVAGQFLRIVSHNSSVFCIYYYDIIDNALPQTT